MTRSELSFVIEAKRSHLSYALELNRISVTFHSPDNPAQRYTAVADTTLRIRAGEFVSVVGPTGCGKSTLLNIGAGLLEASSGEIKVFGEPLRGINRRAGYMFQTEALMPWRSAIGNVMVGLQYRGVPEADARAQAQAWLERVGLADFGDRYPHQLSGGMRKRTALAQVLVLDPDIILMDEPFSAPRHPDAAADGERSARHLGRRTATGDGPPLASR